MDNIFKKGERVIVAMSGGVDSSVTAMLARDAGCHVIGITLKMFDSKVPFWIDAEKTASSLGVEWHLVDYSETFSKDVISYFIREYKEGRTPNPCSKCNQVAKTRYLFDQLQRFDANRIYTGHYANTVEINGQTFIAKGESVEKDQSYYLALIEPFHANFLRFPLGRYLKPYVREIAEKNHIPVADKKDSQEVCFLEGGDYRDYLKPYASKWLKGNIILDGKIIGENKGIHNYTVGQRRGLEISHSEPLYVKEVNAKTGDVTLDIKKYVFAKGVSLRDCSFYPSVPYISKKFTAKLRYRMKEEPCIFEQAPNGKCNLLFDKPQFAPTPGQTAAIYDGDTILGGGTIDNIFN